jgi:uncharacterized membrane protein
VPAMFFMIGAVVCFYVGDLLTRYAAYGLRVNPTLVIRLIVGLALVAAVAFLRRPKFDWRNTVLFFVIARAVAYAATILCFASAFRIGKEMTSVYVISFLWPFILATLTALIARIPEELIRTLHGVKPMAAPARSTIAYSINGVMFVGIVVYYWPRLASDPLFFLLSPEGLWCFGAAFTYALINALDPLIPLDVGRWEKLVAALTVSLVMTGFFWFVEVRGGLALVTYGGTLALPLLQAAGAGLFSMLGLVCLTEAMGRGNQERVAPLDYLIIALSAGWTILYDHVWPSSSFEWIGIALILIGAAVLMLMAWRQPGKPTS